MDSSPLLPSKTSKKYTDASFAKKYLSKTNYLHGSLHTPAANNAQLRAVIQKNEELRNRFRRTPGRKQYHGPLNTLSNDQCEQELATSMETAIDRSRATVIPVEEDVFRLPESSDDEVAEPVTVPSDDFAVSGHRPVSRSSSSTKRKADKSMTARHSKRLRQESPQREKSSVDRPRSQMTTSDVRDNLFDNLESSQARKTKGKVKTFSSSQRSKDSFSCPEPVVQVTPKKDSKHKDMLIVKNVETQSPIKTPKRFKATSITPKSDRSHKHDSAFQLPDLLDGDKNNQSFNSALALSTNDSFESPLHKNRRRRGSSSSLSSADSLVDYQLSKQDKHALMNGDDMNEIDPRTQVRCPMCKRITNRKDSGIYDNPDNLTLKKQQKFCYNHRIRDAERQWQESAYPRIDWNGSFLDRIDQQKSVLSKVIRREKDSYYFSELESKMKEAKGNQSAIKRYFDSGVMEVVDQGYYGPQGSKIIANAIANDEALRKLFERQSRSDRTIRATGFGRFVDTVLVPELTLNLVMEDMALDDQVKGREVLRDSTEVGLLLYPGDDYVVRVTEN